MSRIFIEAEDHCRIEDVKGNVLEAVLFDNAPIRFADETDQRDWAVGWAIEQLVVCEPVQLSKSATYAVSEAQGGGKHV